MTPAITNNEPALIQVKVENLYKVFGGNAEEALRQYRDGKSRDAVFEESGALIAVADVSFEVPAGETFVVMGLSGSGKSTLIRCLNRLITPTAGTIEIAGEDVLEAGPAALRELRRRKLGMVFQHFALLPHKTVAENVEYGLKIRGVDRSSRRESALEALEQVGLRPWADTYPANLSGGMQQRVGLARAMAVDPDILLMDEPFSALDPLIRRDMQQELLRLQSQLQKTIIFITHDLHEALILGDRVAIMKEGRFVQLGTAEEIVGEPADDYVASFTKDVDRSRVFRVASTMHPAITVDRKTATLATARDSLRGSRDDAAFVTDDDGRVAGVVTLNELVDGVADADADIGAVMRTEFPVAAPDDQLADIYDACSRGLPVAVLDRDGRLAGAVRASDVFARLSREDGAGARATGAQSEQ